MTHDPGSLTPGPPSSTHHRKLLAGDSSNSSNSSNIAARQQHQRQEQQKQQPTTHSPQPTGTPTTAPPCDLQRMSATRALTEIKCVK